MTLSLTQQFSTAPTTFAPLCKNVSPYTNTSISPYYDSGFVTVQGADVWTGTVFTDGLNTELDFISSPDGVSCDVVQSITAYKNQGQSFSVDIVSPYVRLIAKNLAGVDQTVMRLASWFRTI